MTDRSDFERRLEARLQVHADRALRPFDAAALAGEAVTAGGRRRAPGRRWWHGITTTPGSTLRVAFVGLLLLVAVAAGTVLVGAALRSPGPITDPLVVVPQPTSAPSPAPVADTDPTPVPTPTPVVSIASPDPSLTAAGVGVGPCAAMVQLLDSWVIYEPDPPVTLGPAGQKNGYILIASASGISGVDGTSAALKLPAQELQGRIPEIPGYGLPIAQGGRFVPAPDGQAIAVEEGDVGAAGCGEPLVRFAKGGMLRPFAVRAFQAITDLAWAPDGSALYGILRPTIDAAGKPLITAPEDVEGFPGTVLRWDVRSREVTDIGAPCPTCRLNDLTVSPDGSRVVVNTADAGAAVHDPDGSWRSIGEVPRIIGWTPDGLMVVEGYDHIDTVDLDGRVVTTSGRICCHGNGYGGLLSPDGTTVVGSTLSADFRVRDIVLVDVRDGSQRTIAHMPNPNGEGVKGPSDPHTTPNVAHGRMVAWAPDGKALLMLDLDQDGLAPTRLWSLSLDTFTTSEPIEVPLSQPPVVAWLPKL
jgi:hypothetical protein